MLSSPSAISDTSRPQLDLSIKPHNLWCQARALLLPVPQEGKMSASKLIHYFSGSPVAFGFCVSLPSDKFTLNPANKRIDQSLSDFQNSIGAVAHATLDKEQIIHHIRTAVGDTIASLQGSDGGMIAVMEVHELLTKIHDILDNVVS